jgi:hypothetical protein
LFINLDAQSTESEKKVSKFLNKHFRIFAGVCLSILSVSIPFNFATKSETYQLIDKFNIHTDSGMSSVAVLVYFVAYLSLFFAMATPNLNIRRKLISIASLPLIWASLPYSLRAFKVKIVTFDDFVLTALLIIMGITFSWLAISTVARGVNSVKDLYVQAVKGEHKVTSFVLAIIPFCVTAALLNTYIPILLPSYSDLPKGSDYNYSCITDGLLVIALIVASLLVVAYLRPYFDNLSTHISNWLTYLRDFSIETYITRKISALIYRISYVVLAGCAAYVPIYQNTGFLDSIIAGEFIIGKLGVLIPLFTFPISLLVAGVTWFLAMAVVRLLFEFSNAIIHIAQNTTKN